MLAVPARNRANLLYLATKAIFCYTYVMPSRHIHTIKFVLGWATVALGSLTAGVLAAVAYQHVQSPETEAWLVRPKVEYTWVVLKQEEIEKGVSIPPDTHVIFHLPESFESISRENLLGHQGKNVRYWGYCFPSNYDPALVDKRSGFPGLLFLSEKERAVRAAEEARQRQPFDVANLPTEEEIQRRTTQYDTDIRHQVEVFRPANMCYIMTEAPLAMGLDPDGDRLNNKLERDSGTDPTNPDSDSDGITDGVEYLYGTDPLQRDTDGDGVIDGLEDENWNGRINADETDPRTKDTDRDGLCDGFCREHIGRNDIYLGEDKNLNGIVDEGETNPRKVDSDNDGYSDEVEFMQCLASGKVSTECP